MIDYFKNFISKTKIGTFTKILLFIIFYLFLSQSCMRMRMSSTETSSYFKAAKITFIEKTIRFKNYNMHYVESGSNNNQTVVFVHGSPGSWDAYKMYLRDSLLLKKYRLIAVDRPGFGHSNFGIAQDLKVQTKRMLAFIDTLQLNKPIIVVGYSLGGPLVLSMAAARTKMFRDVVVISGAVDPGLENPEKWRLVFMAKPIRYFVPGALRPSNDELWWLKNDLVNLQPDLKKIQSTVTIIHGDKDRLVPYANMKYMQLYLENSKKTDTLTIKNADHFIPWSHFDIIRNKILQL